MEPDPKEAGKLYLGMRGTGVGGLCNDRPPLDGGDNVEGDRESGNWGDISQATQQGPVDLTQETSSHLLLSHNTFSLRVLGLPRKLPIVS